MKGLLLTVVVLICAARAAAQEPQFQTGHTHDILTVKFSPDDRQLISFSAADGRLCLWDVTTGRLLWAAQTEFVQKAEEYYNLKEFRWSADARHVVTASHNGTFQTWDARTGRVLAVSDRRPAIKLAPERPKRVSVTTDLGSFRLTDTQTGAARTLEAFSRTGDVYDVTHDGRLFAEGGSWGDASIKLTELATGEARYLDGHPSVVRAIAFSPDGKLLAVAGSDKNIYLFDAASRALKRTLKGHTRPVSSVSFSPDGATLLSAAEYELMKVWDLRAGRLVRDVESKEDLFGVQAAAFSPDGDYFLTTSDRTAFRLWDARTFDVVRVFKTAEGYESHSGQMVLGYDAVPVTGATFGGDGRRIFSAHVDGTLRVWDTRGGRQLASFKLGERVSLIRPAPDGNHVLVAVGRGEKLLVKLVNVEDGREAFAFDDEQTSHLEALAFSPDGRRFATSDVSGDVLLWDVSRPKHLRVLDDDSSGDDALAFSPDGKLLAAGGRNQNLSLYDAATGERLWRLIAPRRPGALEARLLKERGRRRAELHRARARRDAQAALDAAAFGPRVHITFEHYGTMTEPGELRMMETGEPVKSRVRMSAAEADAVWLRLRNDSPLPVEIPTQSAYLPKRGCAHVTAGGKRVLGLCDGMEIAVWFGLEDKEGKSIPYGFDLGSTAYLLPKTSVLFAVPLGVLKDGNAISFEFTFQKEFRGDRVEDYGEPVVLKFKQSDLPRAGDEGREKIHDD